MTWIYQPRYPGWRLLLSLALLSSTAHAASLFAYISPPGQMSSIVTGVTTETFNNTSLLTSTSTTYNSVIGTYTVPNGYILPVIAADQYGGANNSQYMFVGTRKAADATTVTLTLAAPADYFGFWWSAGDSLNRLSIYSGSLLVATFQTSDIINLLKTNPLIAINGTNYQSSAYYGNPNTGTFHGQNSGEPFAYVSIVALGFSFDKIVFDNNGTSGFENDNHSVYSGVVDVPTNYASFVQVADVPLINNPVPEPATGEFVGIAVACGLFALRKRIR